MCLQTQHYDIDDLLAARYGDKRELLWLTPDALSVKLPTEPTVNPASAKPHRRSAIGVPTALALIRAYVREHLVIGRDELSSIYAPSLTSAAAIRQQNPLRPHVTVTAPAAAIPQQPVVFATANRSGQPSIASVDFSESDSDADVISLADLNAPSTSSRGGAGLALPPKQARGQRVIADSDDDGSDVFDMGGGASKAAKKPISAKPPSPDHIDGWGGTSFDDDGLDAMILTESASPAKPKPAQQRSTMMEVLRRLGGGGGAGSKPGPAASKALPFAPLGPSAVEGSTGIRRVRTGRLERLRETMLQVLLQLQLCAMSPIKRPGGKAVPTAVPPTEHHDDAVQVLHQNISYVMHVGV